MSKKSDLRIICQAIAGHGHGLTHFELEGCQCVAGPLAALTPFCSVRARKMREEYRIDYDVGLVVARNDLMTLGGLQHQIRSGEYLWKHNVYPKEFKTLSTLTTNRRPTDILISRIRRFLLEHSKSRCDALAFVQAGDTEFLRDCRRLKPADFEKKLLEKLAGGHLEEN